MIRAIVRPGCFRIRIKTASARGPPPSERAPPSGSACATMEGEEDSAPAPRESLHDTCMQGDEEDVARALTSYALSGDLTDAIGTHRVHLGGTRGRPVLTDACAACR